VYPELLFWIFENMKNPKLKRRFILRSKLKISFLVKKTGQCISMVMVCAYRAYRAQETKPTRGTNIFLPVIPTFIAKLQFELSAVGGCMCVHPIQA
jgi:hypothetical protein